MACTARTSCTAAPATAPAADGSDDDDDCSGDAEETEETNKVMSDPDPDPKSSTKAGPNGEPVTTWTMKCELTQDYYENIIRLNRMASYVFVDQGMKDMRDFLRIKPENIKKICATIIKQNKTNIPVIAMECLTLLAYYVKHQEWTSCNDKEFISITSNDLDGLAHHMEVELNWDKKNKTPEPTPVNLDETSAHKAFSNMRGHNDIPLTYVVRPRILPPD
jgi:hypothetical protein